MRQAIGLLFLIACVFTASASNDRAFFWEVKSTENKTSSASVYLMGSIHFADKSFYPLRKVIEDKYDSSDFLVVELNSAVIDPQRYKKIVSERGEYKGDDGIENHITPETLTSLKKQLKLFKIPLSAVRKSKPGLLVTMLSMVQVIKMGYTPGLGIDQHFLNKDKEKPIIELESLEQQLDLLINMAEGDLLLRETLSSMEKSREFINRLMLAWKAGDESAMTELLFVEALREYPSFEVVYDQLFYERNITMTDKIKQFLKKDASYFVIVGAGHLVGDKGIVRLLKNSGYSVTRH